jgi:hypothetical protein
VTEQADWPDPSSDTWARVEYDIAVWVPCPPGFPPGYDRERWAQMYASNFWKRPGLTYSDLDIAMLAARLAEIHRDTYGHIPCHQAFIHLPDPRLSPLPVYLATWKSAGGRDEQLRALTHADDPEAVRPPIVDQIQTEGLGAGLRALVHLPVEGEAGAIYGALSYAWRVEDYGTDLRLFTVCRDLGRLQRAMPDIEELGWVTTIVPLTGQVGTEGWSSS